MSDSEPGLVGYSVDPRADESRRVERKLPVWLWAVVSIVLGVASILLANAVDRSQLSSRVERTTLEAGALRAAVAAVLTGTSRSSAQLAGRMGNGTYANEAAWRHDVANYINGAGDPYTAVQVFDRSMHPGWLATAASGTSPSNAGLVSALVEAQDLRTPVVMAPVEVAAGVWTYRLAVPIPGGGAIALSHSFGALLDPLLGPSPYAIDVLVDGRVVYARRTSAAAAERVVEAMTVPGATWSIAVTPSEALVAQGSTPLPRALLIFGLLLSGSVGWSVALARRSALRACDIQHAWSALEREVVDRRNAEDSLRATSALQRAILEHASSIMMSLDLDGTVRSFNRTAERMLGYSSDEVVGRQTPEIFDPEQVARRAQDLAFELGRPINSVFEVFVATLKPGEPQTQEWTHVARDGRRFPVEMSLSAILDDGGKVTGYVAVSIDISERRQAELLKERIEGSLRSTEELLHGVLDASTNGIMATRALRDPSGAIEDFEILLVNPAIEQMLKKSPGSLTGRHLRSEMTGDVDGSMLQTFIDVTQTRKLLEIERHYVHEGLDAWLRITAAPLAEGVALTIEDISQRKSADDDLAEYVSEVESSRDQIHKQSVLLQWQAEELTQARDEALAGTREMQTALGMQADFVSFASHQLRTPLAGIKWLLELAIEEPGVEGELRSYLVDSRESAERLIGLVNDLLDIARLEGGRTVAAPARVDLAELCRELTGQMQPNVAKRQHTLSVAGIDDPAPVFVDGAMVLQAIQNLLSNAIKYTPDGGQVRMTLIREGGEVICTVEDSGIGVPEAARSRLFEKFFRADNVLTMETEGTGLGLFMVRLILEKFGGRIWYEPRPDGTGSRFAFALPAYEESNDPGQADLDSRGRSRAA